MKIVVVISLFLCVFGTHGQDSLKNYSPANAYSLCDDPSKSSFGPSSGFVCQGGYSKLYYTLKPLSNYTLGTGSLLKFKGVSGGVTVSTSFKLYGPFNYGDDYATWVENNTVTPLATGAALTGQQSISASILGNKHYMLVITIQSCSGEIEFETTEYNLGCRPPRVECESCLPLFQPVNGDYLVTGWVKEEGAGDQLNYTNCEMHVISNSITTNIPASGQIVDGWQRMEELVTTGAAGDFKVELLATVPGAVCYFDDIRVIPYDGSMVTYVYDPVTMRLIAELDERNYAKVYEYDEEGKLIRVKKETEKGFMTIQETKENTAVKEGY